MSSFARSAAFVAALALPALASAQDTGRGFLFGAPAGALTVSGGWAGARAQSDLFQFTTEQLTLNRRDFSSPTLGADLAFEVTGRTQVVLSGGYSGIRKNSYFRAFIDNNNQNIEQNTTFRRVPVTLSVKQYLTAPGRSIGKFAWIPARFAPYAGVGAGLQYYKFQQEGDFIDTQTMEVFARQYASDGWSPVADALAGFDYTLSPRFAITTEGRYQWSSAALSQDFSGFSHLDLSGFTTTVGLTVRF